MIKKISAVLLTAALLGGLTSCYMPDSIFPDSGFDVDEETLYADALSVYSFEFQLGGVEYELPMSYTTLSSRGWKLMGSDADEADTAASDLPAAPAGNDAETVLYSANTPIEPGEYSEYVPADKGSDYVALKFYNDTKKTQALQDCLVVGVMVENDSEDDEIDFLLDGDITLGKTYEEVVTTYGKPSYVKDIVTTSGELAAINDIAFIDGYDEESDDLTRTLYYSVGETLVVSFELGQHDEDDDAVVRIEMQNDEPMEDVYDYKKDLKSRSSVMKLYKSPNLLGKTFNDFAFKYENKLYTLPIPVQSLIDDGWVFVRGAAERIPSGTTMDGLVMRKGNLAMSLLVHNYDLKRPQTPINCYAVSLSASVVGPNVKILMPKGVTLGSEYGQLVTAFGTEYARLSGYDEEAEAAAAAETGEAADNATAEKVIPVGETETYELTEEEGCKIVKTVDEEFTKYSYIMPDDVPTIELPVSITDIKDPNVELLGGVRKHIDVYLSNENGKILKVYLQNCPEYMVNEAEIIEQQMEAAEKAAKEAEEAAKAAEAAQAAQTSGGAKTVAAAEDSSAKQAETAVKPASGAASRKTVVEDRLNVLSRLSRNRLVGAD